MHSLSNDYPVKYLTNYVQKKRLIEFLAIGSLLVCQFLKPLSLPEAFGGLSSLR
jgi:hypothetical protein